MSLDQFHAIADSHTAWLVASRTAERLRTLWKRKRTPEAHASYMAALDKAIAAGSVYFSLKGTQT